MSRIARIAFLLTALPWGAAPALSQEAGRAAESDPPRMVMYAEVAGNALDGYSLNAEVRLYRAAYLRAGFSTHGGIPVMANYLWRLEGAHHLETGAGVVLALGTEWRGFGTATIGYRYQPHQGGFVFKIAYTPVFARNGITESRGVAVGLSSAF